MGKPFQPGNEYGKTGGRPKGSRSALATHVLQDVLAHWNAPVRADGTGPTKGQAALEILLKTRPADYVKVVASLLPRELMVESVAGQLGDDELDRMIEILRERFIASREERSLDQIAQVKLVEHVR